MPQVQSPTNPNVRATLTLNIHEHWRMFMAEGAVLSVLGLAAMVVPTVAGLSATFFLGWVFLVAGVVGLVATFKGSSAGFGWSLTSALVALVAGTLLLWNPLQSLVLLTYVLIGFFIIDGVSTIMIAIAYRRELSGRWEWMMVNGVIDLFIAGVVISGLPGTLQWALGLLVGIDLIFGGASLMAMAMAARTTESSANTAH